MQITGPSKQSGFLVSIFAVWLLTPIAYADLQTDLETCNSCHGDGGVSMESDVPSIAGMSAFVLEEYMFEYQDAARPCHESKYRSGDTERPATDMCAIAKELGEDQILELAEFYGSKSFVPAKQEFDAALAANGAGIHKRECEKCHSDGGSYADDDAGMLAGQWMPYLEQVFAEYATGERSMMEDKMKDKVDALDAESITALLHYYASLQ